MQKINGTSGDLVLRLAELLRSDEAIAHEATIWIGHAIGGEPARLWPDDGAEMPPDSIMSRFRAGGLTRPIGAYIDVIEERVAQVVDEGLDERFVVESLVALVDGHFDGATLVAATNENRAELADALRETLNDPVLLAQYRADTGADDDRSDAEYRADLERLIERRLGPTPPLEVVDRWEVLKTWRSLVNEYLGPDVFSRWQALRAANAADMR